MLWLIRVERTTLKFANEKGTLFQVLDIVLLFLFITVLIFIFLKRELLFMTCLWLCSRRLKIDVRSIKKCFFSLSVFGRLELVGEMKLNSLFIFFEFINYFANFILLTDLFVDRLFFYLFLDRWRSE